ncbi:MAG TPA: hypothetical protein PLH14_03775 [Sphaerochaeta sp.]|nr:hypothetical protein [Sphaerochaeta sp.]HQB90529.1 hypothetical protein [Sphaerochaeta sp.]
MIVSYAIQRKSHALICLTPLSDPKTVETWSSDEEMVLKTSTLLTKRQNDEVTFSLYNTIDYSVDRWIQDKQYVPRLLVSAVVFTISYFIFSLAVRDPIPMIDELVISSILAIVTWRAIARRDSRSAVAQHRRHELKVRSSERQSVIVDELFALEEYLDTLESYDTFTLANALCRVGDHALPPLEHTLDETTKGEVTELLVLYLRRSAKQLHGLSSQIAALHRSKSSSPKLAGQLYQQTMNKGIDLPLLALAAVLQI